MWMDPQGLVYNDVIGEDENMSEQEMKKNTDSVIESISEVSSENIDDVAGGNLAQAEVGVCRGTRLIAENEMGVCSGTRLIDGNDIGVCSGTRLINGNDMGVCSGTRLIDGKPGQ